MFNRNDSDQLLTLKILAGILQNTDPNEARHFLDTLIDSFQTHSNADCRVSFLIVQLLF